MKLYCVVNRLKKEHIKDYKDYHENAHKTEWKTQIRALRESGAQICNVYLYDDLSIVLFGCDDLNELYANMAKNEDNNKWQALMADFFAQDAKFDGTKTEYAEKIFDLNEQAQGFLNKE